MRLLLVAPVALAACWFTTPAAADSGSRWLVLPHSVGHGKLEQKAAESVVMALGDRPVDALSLHEASDRYNAHSRTPAQVDDSDLDVLARDAQQALEHVAFGRREAARKSVASVMQRAEKALESLNRETETARHVLDACLALVRSTLRRGDRRAALAEAMRCRRLVPDVTPGEMTHPASVIGVLAEADNQLKRLAIGRLTVESAPRSGCAVFVNGRHLGTTPFVLGRAAAGPYRVQVECARRERGRVRTVKLGPEPVVVRVDTTLDSSVTTEPQLSLVYRDEAARSRHLHKHARAVGQAVGASDVVLVGRADLGRVVLSRYSLAAGRLVARVDLAFSVRGGFERSSLSRGLDDLQTGRGVPGSVDRPETSGAESAEAATPSPVRGERSPAEASERPEAAPPSVRNQRARRIAGGVVLAIGVGGVGAGAALQLRAASLEDSARQTAIDDPAFQGRQQEYEDARRLPLVGLVGGALASVGVGLVLPETDGVPWWSWVSGVAGLAAGVIGTYEIATRDECNAPAADGQCLGRKRSGTRGAVWWSGAAPLLSVNLAHVLRWALPGHGDAAVALTPSGGDVVYRRSF